MTTAPSSSKPDATFWHQATPGTTYWRMQVPAKAMPAACNRLRYSDLIVDVAGGVQVPRQQGQTAVWQFLGNARRALIAAHQQDQGLRVLMEVDDLYLVPAPQAATLGSTWQVRVDRDPASDRYSH